MSPLFREGRNGLAANLSRVQPLRSLSLTGPLASAATLPQAATPLQEFPQADPSDQVRVSAPRPRFPRLGKVLRALALATTLGATVATGTAGLTTLHQARGHQSLLASDADLTQNERGLAEKEMDLFPSSTLHWLGKRGVTIQVTHGDQEVADMLQEYGTLRPLDRARVASDAVAVHQAMERLRHDPAYQALGQQIEQLTSEMARLRPAGMGMGGYGMALGGMAPASGCNPPAPDMVASPYGGMMPRAAPVPEALIKLSNQYFEVTGQRSKMLSQAAGPWARPGVGFPASVEFMEKVAGVSTPQERAEFRAYLKAANGDRLEQAQQKALSDMEAGLDKLPESFQAAARQQLEEMRQHPEKILFNTADFQVVTPPVRYVGGVMLPAGDDKGVSSIDALGLYMGGVDKIQVDDVQLGKSRTLSHELGHAIEDQLRKGDPGFYADFSPRLEQAYQQARARPDSPASQYGLTDRGEYIAEGVRLHFENPQALEKADPALSALTHEMLEQAAHQPGGGLLKGLAWLAVAGYFGMMGAALARKP